MTGKSNILAKELKENNLLEIIKIYLKKNPEVVKMFEAREQELCLLKCIFTRAYKADLSQGRAIKTEYEL